jgi:integrase
LRYRGLVLLATFASLRWGEAIALRRCDVDLHAGHCPGPGVFRGTVNRRDRSRAAEAQGRCAGSRYPEGNQAGSARSCVPLRRPGSGGAGLPGAKGDPLCRGNFNKMAAWPHAVQAIGAEGLRFHDLRHTGNAFAAASGAGCGI